MTSGGVQVLKQPSKSEALAPVITLSIFGRTVCSKSYMIQDEDEDERNQISMQILDMFVNAGGTCKKVITFFLKSQM